MTEQQQKEHVRELINTLYERAGIKMEFRGEINEDVAAVIGDLLTDISSCSAAFRWVPRPSGGKASIVWLATNITRSILADLKEKQSVSCMRARILYYRSFLELAAAGLGY
ncbi:hypothetical protein WG68_10355 [Arsukibacterium ikkense]|uniref:Uncharacterized protein n=1 Tax=Arsukibacterium ikkense TaxID=336831 RepID=A0A0M2V8E6_9GAMM|nr:hypothetical protein [Arsukibacterium ikkense]KKO45443.1 hypothetical protein WG68_10355 [Arsukibacterium ikkense]